MKTINIVHIGDIHFPQHRNDRPLDSKDGAFPPALIAQLSHPKIRIVLREIASLQQRNPDCALLISGDLTTGGLLAEYKDCVAYIASVLNLPKWNSDLVHVVPGNHDVDRGLCTKSMADAHPAKFNPLVATWSNPGLPPLTAQHVRSTTITQAAAKVSLNSLNSCVGCGEWRLLPGQIQAELGALFNRIEATFPAQEAFALIGEQLDTPMFLIDDVDMLESHIRGLAPNCVPVILAHHNLLPQSTTRVSLYTELINSGSVRSRLTRCSKPILYCHGHIHDDVVEVVVNPSVNGSCLVSVSAPELVQGFNFISIHFSSTGMPLGIEVFQYKLRNDGSIGVAGSIRIALQKSTHSSVALPGEAVDLVASISAHRTRLNAVTKDYRTRTGRTATKASIQSWLLQAEWLDLVSIPNRSDSADFWTIERSSK